MLDVGADAGVSKEGQQFWQELAGKHDAVDLSDHPLHGKTFTLFVNGWDGGSLNKWLGFAWRHEWMYAKYNRGDAMPTHFVRYPGYPNTYLLRNDWDGMQTYVCSEIGGDGFNWLRAGCGDRGRATPLEFKRQSNGQYKIFNRQFGYHNYVSYINNPTSPSEHLAVRSAGPSSWAMTVSLTSEPNLLAPHTVRICYEAILVVEGGSSGNYTHWVRHQHGKTETKTYEKDIIAETSLSIDLKFPFLNFLGSPSVTSSLKAAARDASSVTTTSMIDTGFNVTVDLSEPCYMYSAEVRTTYKNAGVVVQKSANRHFFFQRPLSTPCVTHTM